MARGFIFFVLALFALVLSVVAQGPAVKSPKNNKPDAARAEGSEWVDEDPKMQLAGDAGPAEFSRAKVFLEATAAAGATTASGSPSAPNEAPKETGHVPAPGKYTHVTAGGAKLGAIPLPEEGFPRLWHPPAPAPAPAAPPAPAPAPASKKGKAVAGAAAPKAKAAPKAAPPAKAPKNRDEKKKPEPAVVVVPAPGKKGAKAPAPAPAVAVAAPAPAPIDSSVVSVASADAGGDEVRPRHGLATAHIQVDDDGNVLRCHTGPDGEERCH